MARTRSRTLALLAAGVALLVSLTACGDGSKAEPAGTAVDKTAFVDGLLSAIKKQKSAQAKLTLGSTVTATAVFAYGGAEPEAGISADVFGQKIEIISVDGQFYLKKNAATKFVKLAKDDPSLSMFGGFADVDPQQALTGIADGIKTVRDLGPATVDGEELTRFTVTLDGEAIGSGMLGMIPGVDLSRDLELDLYVDDGNLVHRAEADLGDNDLTLTVTDWGEPVKITAPPAAEILQN